MKVKTVAVAVAADQSEKRTTGASIERKTSLRLHLHNQSQPLLTDVRLIELSAGFSCFLSSLFHALGNVLYFTLTPFTAKDILMYIYVNIFFFFSPRLLSGRRGESESAPADDRPPTCPG